MSKNILQTVTDFALSMIKLAENGDVEGFEKQYAELQQLCATHEKSDLNHPVQWETLADFTQDSDVAIELYKKALASAEKLKEHQYSASIHFALADRYSELDNPKVALDHANKAKVIAAKYDDEELKQEIESLILFLSPH